MEYDVSLVKSVSLSSIPVEDKPLAFLNAAYKGNLQTVQEFIDGGVEKETRDSQRQNILHKAAMNGHSSIVLYAIQLGVDVNTKDYCSRTPLHLAAANGWLTIAHCLVKAEADMEAVEDTNSTPLFLAASRGRLEVVQYLTRSGANTTTRDWKGRLPSEVATEEAHHKVAKFLDVKSHSESDTSSQDGNGDVGPFWKSLGGTISSDVADQSSEIRSLKTASLQEQAPSECGEFEESSKPVSVLDTFRRLTDSSSKALEMASQEKTKPVNPTCDDAQLELEARPLTPKNDVIRLASGVLMERPLHPKNDVIRLASEALMDRPQTKSDVSLSLVSEKTEVSLESGIADIARVDADVPSLEPPAEFQGTVAPPISPIASLVDGPKDQSETSLPLETSSNLNQDLCEEAIKHFEDIATSPMLFSSERIESQRHRADKDIATSPVLFSSERGDPQRHRADKDTATSPVLFSSERNDPKRHQAEKDTATSPVLFSSEHDASQRHRADKGMGTSPMAYVGKLFDSSDGLTLPQASFGSHQKLPANELDKTRCSVLPASSVKLGERIGQGSFGFVSDAEVDGQAVAVKTLNTSLELDEDDIIKLQGCKHKHLITIVGVCTEPLLIVMERFAVSLFHRLHYQKHVPVNAHKALSESASALAYLHRVCVCHGNVKTENVLLHEGNDTAKLTDFGIAPLQKGSNAFFGCKHKTRTVAYSAPELLTAGRSTRPRFSLKSDVFAFGMLAWEVSSRRTPYDRWSAFDIMSHTEEGSREDLRKVDNVEMRLLIQRSWVREPIQRPDMEDVVTELSRLWWASVRQMI